MDDTALEETRRSYDAVAARYADTFGDELVGKPLDRALLDCFAERVAALAEPAVVVDLGCGPGQVADYLTRPSLAVCGLDLSPAMVSQARHRCTGVHFQIGSLLDIPAADQSVQGLTAFYSIIHLPPEQVREAFVEFRRVLVPDGLVLLAFHSGDGVDHVDTWWGESVELTGYFFDPEDVAAWLIDAGFVVEAATNRAPINGQEYSSTRCYLLARA